MTPAELKAILVNSGVMYDFGKNGLVGWTGDGLGTSDYRVVDQHLIATTTLNAIANAYIWRPLPRLPAVITMPVSSQLANSDYGQSGLLIGQGDPASTRFATIGAYYSTQVRTAFWNHATSHNSYPAAVTAALQSPMFYRIVTQGTSGALYQYSYDGETWVTVFNDAEWTGTWSTFGLSNVRITGGNNVGMSIPWVHVGSAVWT